MVIAFVLIPFFAGASFIVCDPVPTQGGPAVPCTFNSLLGLANLLIKFCITIGLSLFSIMFAYAGFLYLTAVGNEGKIKQAHTIFFDAIIGFVIMLGAWLLVDFIFSALKVPISYRLLGN